MKLLNIFIILFHKKETITFINIIRKKFYKIFYKSAKINLNYNVFSKIVKFFKKYI